MNVPDKFKKKKLTKNTHLPVPDLCVTAEVANDVIECTITL